MCECVILKEASAQKPADTTGKLLYGVTTISRLLKIVGLFCKRAL